MIATRAPAPARASAIAPPRIPVPPTTTAISFSRLKSALLIFILASQTHLFDIVVPDVAAVGFFQQGNFMVSFRRVLDDSSWSTKNTKKGRARLPAFFVFCSRTYVDNYNNASRSSGVK